MRAIPAILVLNLLFATGNDFAQRQVFERGKSSCAELADQALREGDYESARELYAKWLDADPGDSRAWYNYACALALSQDTSSALDALNQAVETGWRDATRAARDPDLSCLRGGHEFAEILQRIHELVSEETALNSGPTLRYARQTRYAPYQLHLPQDYNRNPGKRYPLLILLHGRSGNMSSMNDVREHLAATPMIIAQPQAAFAIGNGSAGYEYWPSQLAGGEDEELLRAARDDAGRWVLEVVQAVIAENLVDTAQVYLIGFSQGAAAAFLAALQNPRSVRGFAMLGGYIPETHRDTASYHELGHSGIEVFLGHGRDDRSVEPGEAQLTRRLLQQAGVNVVLKQYPAGHEVPGAALRDLADWLKWIQRQPRRWTDIGAVDTTAAGMKP